MAAINEQTVFQTKAALRSLSAFPFKIGPVEEVETLNLTVGTINNLPYPPPPGTGFVTLTGVETLSNKSLVDNSTYIIDATNATIRMMFDAAGAANTTATIRATQAANRTYTMPDMGADTDFIFAAGPQTITGSKLFTAGALRVANNVDTSVYTTFTTGPAPAGTVANIVTTGLAASRSYFLIDPGTNTEILLGMAAQIIPGQKTFAESARMARIADSSVYMRFIPGASPPNTVTTIATAVQTSSYTYTIPNVGGAADFVMSSGSQVVTGKSFIDSGTFIVDSANNTIRMAFDPTGSPGTTATIRSTQTANRAYTIPNGTLASDSFVLASNVQTITNKTMTNPNNTIAAQQLHNTTGTVDVSASAAPLAGYILTAITPTTAAWQAPTPGGSTFSDALFSVYDSVDPTINIAFDAAGNAGTTATIRAQQTANRTYTIPNALADDTFTLLNTAQTLTNKTLTTPTIAQIVNVGTLTLPTSTDTLVGRATTDTLTNKTLTNPIIAQIVNVGTLTLPTSTDTLVGRATTDTLTNKTITSTTNTVAAQQLHNLTGTVDVSGSAAPSLGQVLTATGASTATWQTPASAPTTFVDTTFAILDNVDNTIRIAFDATGTANTTTTLRATQTADRVITFPSGAVAANVLLSEGNQTANGVNTFTASVVTPVITETVANAGTVVNNVRLRSRALAAPAIRFASVEAGGAVNTYLGLLPSGTGAIVADTPDNAATGGNARGTNAVDFQMSRAAATQVASGANSGLFVGTNNTSAGINSAVLSGTTNAVSAGTNVAIVTGLNNALAGGIGGIICAGDGNVSAAVNGIFIGAGSGNTVNNLRGAIVAGSGNTVSNTDAVVVSGVTNSVSGLRTGVLCGVSNTLAAGTTNSAIVGGNTNQITVGTNAFIGGGANNVISVNTATIAGGIGNTIAGLEGFIGGGDSNDVQVLATNGVIAGGLNNTVTGADGAVCGGNNNTAALAAFVGGGSINNATGNNSVVAGGGGNTASAQNAGVLAGQTNGVSAARGFAGAGLNNTVTSIEGAVVAGSGNTAGPGQGAFVSAGAGNTASGANAAVGGGSANTASGLASGVPYGQNNTASGDYSGAFGRLATASATGAMTINDGSGTALANTFANRLNIRFLDGYRIMTGPTSQVLPVRINNSYYIYSGGQGLTYNGVGGFPTNVWTEIVLPTTDGAIYYEINMVGTSVVNGQFGPTIPWHRPYETGIIAMAPAGYIGTATQSVFTNNRDFSPGLLAAVANSLITTSIQAGPLRLRISMNTGGAYGNNFRWTGVVKFYIQDFKSPDPIS